MAESERVVFHSQFPCSVEELYSRHARQGGLLIDAEHDAWGGLTS